MRQLLPHPAEIDPMTAHGAAARPAPADRPWIALNMVTSADGATAVDGVSGGLGGPADLEVFRAIRSVADVIVAAAGTVRAEDYGPPRASEAARAARIARGQAPVPRLAVVSGSLDLDAASPLFTEAPEPTLVFTVAGAPAERMAALGAVADVRMAGTDRVDLAVMATQLGALGARCVVVEGGPVLNGQLLALDLIDELNLTLSPILVGGTSRRAIESELETTRHLDLAHLWEHEGQLLARYVRPAPEAGSSPG